MNPVFKKIIILIAYLISFFSSFIFLFSFRPSSDSGKLFSFFIFLIGMVVLFGFMSVFVDMLLGEKKEEGKEEEEEKKKGPDEPEERKEKGNEENEIY